jgi:pseudouridine synthase
MIEAGRVRVNGRVVKELGTKAEPTDVIEIDGQPLAKPQRLRYVMLYKPLNVVTTRGEPQNRPTIYDCLFAEDRILHPVGRLDFDSCGLLVLTNDGELTHRLTHPSYEVPKVYRVCTKPWPNRELMRDLVRGVELDDGAARAIAARYVAFDTCELTLTEGRNREVRRMFALSEREVTYLCRTSYGPLSLGRLKPGKARPLRPDEVARLRAAVGLESG